MSATAQILEAALKLETAERLRLVEALSESIDGIGLSDEWEAEIRNRIDDVDSGRAKPVAGDAVFAKLQRRFGGG